MAAYALIDVEITDHVVFAEFRERASAVVKAHGGRFLVQGGATEVLQGDWTPHRVVILEFDSVERVKSWWNSPDFNELKAMLNRSSKATITIAEGV